MLWYVKEHFSVVEGFYGSWYQSGSFSFLGLVICLYMVVQASIHGVPWHTHLGIQRVIIKTLLEQTPNTHADTHTNTHTLFFNPCRALTAVL